MVGTRNEKSASIFFEEMKGLFRDLPSIGSLAVGVGKAIGDTIEIKARELEILPKEADDYFFSELYSRNRRFPWGEERPQNRAGRMGKGFEKLFCG